MPLSREPSHPGLPTAAAGIPWRVCSVTCLLPPRLLVVRQKEYRRPRVVWRNKGPAEFHGHRVFRSASTRHTNVHVYVGVPQSGVVSFLPASGPARNCLWAKHLLPTEAQVPEVVSTHTVIACIHGPCTLWPALCWGLYILTPRLCVLRDSRFILCAGSRG